MNDVSKPYGDYLCHVCWNPLNLKACKQCGYLVCFEHRNTAGHCPQCEAIEKANREDVSESD